MLGLRWNTDQVTLIVSGGTSPDLIGTTFTQRVVLSTVSSVFDLIELTAPFTIRARLLLKQLWKSTGQQWDEEIPKDSQSKFLEWCSKLENISKLQYLEPFSAIRTDYTMFLAMRQLKPSLVLASFDSQPVREIKEARQLP